MTAFGRAFAPRPSAVSRKLSALIPRAFDMMRSDV
jgi:hypothetical protein